MIDTRATHALMIACALLALALTPHAQSQDNAEPAYEAIEVAEGDFEAHATAQGRYTADVVGEVGFTAKRYTGALEVVEVLVGHGKVTAGQMVVKLKAPDMTEQLEAARKALAKAKLSYEWAKKEAQIAKAEQGIAAERRKLGLADTLSAHQRWDEFGKADAYRQAQMQIQSRENRFADASQELKQLEELYAGAKLASRTQDVVLGRARRDLAVSESSLEIARRNHKVMVKETLPNRERDMDNQLRWVKAEYANAAWREEVSQIRQTWAVDSARESFESARDAVAELEEDAEALQVKAERAGVMTAVGLKKGDKVQAGQMFAKLYDPAKGTIKADLSTKDLRVVKEGSEVQVSWDWFDELAMTGVVRHIAWQGQAGGASEAKYQVTVAVDGVAAMIRPGMTASLKLVVPLDGRSLSVPTAAVASDDQGSYCMVKSGDGFERRAVSVGTGNDKLLQIVKGLSAGESVRVPAK